jgi:5-formyltetrahydrofolate cyclo-ligase
VNTVAAHSKSEYRLRMKSILKNISASLLNSKSTLIHKKLVSLDCFKRADIMVGYIPTDREVNTTPLIQAALAGGKSVYVPRIAGEELCFHRITQAEEKLKPNRYGILEPDAGLPLLDRKEMTIHPGMIIVPGLAFDRQKNRLGRGKGYYDRFLGEIKKFTALKCCVVGICFWEQLVPVLPYCENDVPMDAVVTDKEIIQ